MRRTTTLLSIVVASSALIASGCSAPNLPTAATSVSPTSPSTAGGSTPPPLSGEVPAAANDIVEAVGEAPQFANIEVNEASDGLVLHWHGEPPQDLLTEVRANHPTVLVELRSVEFWPGDMRDAARQLVESEAEAGVGAAYVRLDGTGITVQVHKDQVRESLEDLASRLSAKVGYPVDIEPGAPVAASG